MKTAPTRRSTRPRRRHRRRASSTTTSSPRPADDLALYKPALDKVTPADCLAALRAAFARATAASSWSPATSRFPATPRRHRRRLRAIPRRRRRRAADAGRQPTWAYTDFGAAGQSREARARRRPRRHARRRSTTASASISRTPTSRPAASASAPASAAARITEPRDQRGLAALRQRRPSTPAVSASTASTICAASSPARTSASASAPSADAFSFGGGTNRDDLLLAAPAPRRLPHRPRLPPRGAPPGAQGHSSSCTSASSTRPTARSPLEVANLLASGDPRFGLPPKEVMLSRTLDEVKAWLTPQLARGAIEVAIVGDFDLDADHRRRRADLRRPADRASPSPRSTKLRKVSFPARAVHEGLHDRHRDSRRASSRSTGRPPTAATSSAPAGSALLAERVQRPPARESPRGNRRHLQPAAPAATRATPFPVTAIFTPTSTSIPPTARQDRRRRSSPSPTTSPRTA